MKKKVLFISLAFVLIATTLVSATVLAKGAPTPPTPPRTVRFTATMTPTAIDATVISTASWPQASPPNSNAWPIYDMVNGTPTIVGWIVSNRSVTGGVTGDLEGNGIFTYGGILDTVQSGSMQGVLLVNTGGIDTLYLAASGSLAASIVSFFDFAGIATWCSGAGIPVGMFFAQVYNAPALALLPDGDMSFAQIQAWCAAIGVPVPQFLAGVYQTPSLATLPEAALQAMYGAPAPPSLPILQGLLILGAMYSDTLPSLPKTLTAEFSGTLRVDAGTGAFSGSSGQGQFGPVDKTPLTLQLSPAQHVEGVEGAIKLSGTYQKKQITPRKLDPDKLRDAIGRWKDRFPRNNGR